MAQHDRLDVAIRIQAENGTLAGICAAHGLPAKYAADLSRIQRGQPVTAEKRRRIGRALGVYPPARTIPRITPSKAQRERRAALGVGWHDILEKGLACWEAQGNGNG